MIHYDSNTERAEPKQDWMRDAAAADPQYWERETQNFMGAQQVYKANIETAKQRFNQTGGVHIYQVMYGCEWDDETGDVTGYDQYGYDGEDFLVFDLKEETLISPKPQAFITKMKYDHNKVFLAQKKYYLTQLCPDWLKKYVVFGSSVLQRTGVHIVQRMVGCEWNDETGDVTGFSQDGYDGEDFIALDMKTETWIAPKQQAFITKMKWDYDQAHLAYEKNYFTQDCPDWLKKYVAFGSSVLQRTVSPSVSLLQKSPSSPVSCHATGFYPNRIMMFWTKDGEELYEGVDQGEILPNNDGTFQKSIDLDVSSLQAEDWKRYQCVFQISGLKESINTKLDQKMIRTNWGKTEMGGDGDPSSGFLVGLVVGGVVALLLLVGCITGLIFWKKNKKEWKKSYDCFSTESKDTEWKTSSSHFPTGNTDTDEKSSPDVSSTGTLNSIDDMLSETSSDGSVSSTTALIKESEDEKQKTNFV
ncbi:hypothetical protein LDENG_00265120 [Lucifuga dentata]|nr:hypothetical protein LDENG_00265120 [Lucifuga dentata]